MVAPHKNPRKTAYARKLVECLEKYTKVLVITVDNVSSKSMALIRH